jgi:hypothetical protein
MLTRLPSESEAMIRLPRVLVGPTYRVRMAFIVLPLPFIDLPRLLVKPARYSLDSSG